MTDAPLPMTWEEAEELALALVSDRSTPERTRRAVEVLLRYAKRGRRSSTLNTNRELVGGAPNDSTQHFARLRDILDEAQREVRTGLAKSSVPPPEEDR